VAAQNSATQIPATQIPATEIPATEIVATLQGAGDRGARSDELALAVADRGTRHQFSRLRANLVEPLNLGPGLRVLDVGAGSGVLARHAADAGAEAVALEPSSDLAAAARARGEGAVGTMDVVEADVGSFEDPNGFDVVLAVDVLDAGGDPEALLRRLRELTRPDGVLVVAVDNPFALRYLLGYNEDAHGREPWAAVPGHGTMHRRPLAAALDRAGFGAQRWLSAFPDHRLAKVLLDERAYGGAGGPDFVDQLVRWPCSQEPGAPVRLCDDRAAHRALVEAGLGPEVAGSFVVLCAADRSSLDRLVDPHTVAWSFTGDRLARFAAAKTFGDDPSRPVTSRPLDGSGGATQNGWLSQQRPPTQPRVVGRTVEQLFLDACGEGIEAVGRVLGRWRDHLRASETDAGAEATARAGGGRDGGKGGNAPHPFRSRGSRRFLPSDHLDVLLPNFVVGEAGALHYIDDEWRAPSPVDADLVCARALWWLAADVVSRGVIHPWPASLSVDELTEAFTWSCAMGGIVDLDLMKASEAALQSAVSGLPLDHWHASLALLGRSTQTDAGVTRQLPFTALRTTLSAMTAKAHGLEAELASARDATQALQARLDQAEAQRADVAAERDQEREWGAASRRDADSALARAEDLAARLSAQQEDHDRQMEHQRNAQKELREEAGLLTGELSALRGSRLFPAYRRLALRRRRSRPGRRRQA
jgi:SAM-dependent methyltransferase